MKPYKNVYSLQNGKLIKNIENKIEYTDKNGKKRIKTNPTYKDFLDHGKYPLKENDLQFDKELVGYEIDGDFIVPKYKEAQN